MVKKTDSEIVIDVPNLSITSPAKYAAEVRGLGGILFNKMPVLATAPGTKQDQAKISPLEKERATWREKLYYYSDTNLIYLPCENVHESLKEGAKYWGQRIAGEGQKTYTDVISKAVVCGDVSFGEIRKDDDLIVPFGKEVNSCPSKGKRSGSKVHRIRPLLMPWEGTFELMSFDSRLSLEVLRVILTYSGMFIGWADWRPVYGRFSLISFKRIS